MVAGSARPMNGSFYGPRQRITASFSAGESAFVSASLSTRMGCAEESRARATCFRACTPDARGAGALALTDEPHSGSMLDARLGLTAPQVDHDVPRHSPSMRPVLQFHVRGTPAVKPARPLCERGEVHGQRQGRAAQRGEGLRLRHAGRRSTCGERREGLSAT